MSKRILVVGASGMLGSEVVREFRHLGMEVIEANRPKFDITDAESVAQIVGAFGPIDWVINTAAYTAVDRAESEEDLAFQVNGLGPAYLAQACSMAGARLMHISTDFVFDGKSGQPYAEKDTTGPIGVYGSSKLEGELAVQSHLPSAVIARTSWLYGPGGNCFPKVIVRAWLANKNLRVVADQVGTPTCTIDLARLLAAIVEEDVDRGIYHAGGPEAMSWYEFAARSIATFREAFQSDRPQPEIEAIETRDWPTRADRPKFSALSFDKLKSMGFVRMRPVNESLLDTWMRCKEEFSSLF